MYIHLPPPTDEKSPLTPNPSKIYPTNPAEDLNNSTLIGESGRKFLWREKGN